MRLRRKKKSRTGLFPVLFRFPLGFPSCLKSSAISSIICFFRYTSKASSHTKANSRKYSLSPASACSVNSGKFSSEKVSMAEANFAFTSSTRRPLCSASREKISSYSRASSGRDPGAKQRSEIGESSCSISRRESTF